MKKILIVLCIQTIALTTFAQESMGFGLKGGTSHYTYFVQNQDETLDFEKSFRHGVFASFFYDVNLGSFGFRTEVNVIQKGANIAYTRTIPIGIDDEIEVYTEENIRLGYLELGLLGKQNGYKGENLNWDILFGPSIGYAMIGFTKWNEQRKYSNGGILEENFSDLIEFDKMDYRRIDIGFSLVSELSYRVAEEWAILLDTRYQINFLPINEESESGKIRNNGFGILLGFKKFIE